MNGRNPVLIALLMILALPLAAQQSDDRITQLEQKLDELLRQAEAIRAEINSMKGAATPAPEPETATSEDLTKIDVATEPAATPSAQSQAPAAQAKALNPDLSVIGNFTGHAGDNLEGRAPAAVDEVELSAQAFIDPYAKGYFFL